MIELIFHGAFLLKVWFLDKQHPLHMVAYKHVDSQDPPQTHCIRIYICSNGPRRVMNQNMSDPRVSASAWPSHHHKAVSAQLLPFRRTVYVLKDMFLLHWPPFLPNFRGLTRVWAKKTQPEFVCWKLSEHSEGLVRFHSFSKGSYENPEAIFRKTEQDATEWREGVG